MNNYINQKMCSACKGQCCKAYAGSYAPEDLKGPITSELILSKLNEGTFAIDWWEGDARDGMSELDCTYYVRPRHVNEPAIKGSWGGVCVNYSETKGCSLPEENRPYQCRKLKPNYNFITKEASCIIPEKDIASKQDMAIRWIPYQKQLRGAIHKMRCL